jgi:hypothetical protein
MAAAMLDIVLNVVDLSSDRLSSLPRSIASESPNVAVLLGAEGYVPPALRVVE